MVTAAINKRARKKSLRTKSTQKVIPTKPPAADLRKLLQLNQALFARLLSVSVRTLATLEAGAPSTSVVARRLTELQRLTDGLTEVLRSESLGNWLQTPNEAFAGLKPLEVIERGQSDRIWSMIYFLRSGVPV